MEVNNSSAALDAFKLWLEENEFRDIGQIKRPYFVHKPRGEHPGYYVIETRNPDATYEVSMDGEVFKVS